MKLIDELIYSILGTIQYSVLLGSYMHRNPSLSHPLSTNIWSLQQHQSHARVTLLE